MSLFAHNIIFEDKTTNKCEEAYDQETCAQIENNILNMIDDEPLETTPKFEEKNEKKIEQGFSNKDIIGQELCKSGSPRSFSPLTISTQGSNDAYSPSIFSASSNELFNSPQCC